MVLSAAAYPPAAGTRLFIDRNKPLFSRELFDRLKGAFGLVVSLYSGLLVVLKWCRQVPSAPDDPAVDRPSPDGVPQADGGTP